MSSSKQYGLINPKKPSLPLKRPSIFDEDSDSNDAPDMSQTDWIKKSYQKEAERNYQKRAVKTQLNKALEEDPNVFKYDELYDDMQTKKVETIKAKKDVEKKPRYIQSLLAHAERRKRENEYRNERLIQKEREAEGEMYKDKETFVTSAYRKKLEEFKKMDEEERRQDMLEEIGDVTKQKDLSGFYRHLYQSTVSPSDKKPKTATTETNGSKPSKSPSSVSDRLSPEIKKEVEEAFPLSKDRAPGKYTVMAAASAKNRHYRKRKSSSSESEAEEPSKHVVRRKRKPESTPEKSVSKNLDADTDLSSSSSSSGSSSSSSSSSAESDNESGKRSVRKSIEALTSGSEEGEIIESSKKLQKKMASKSEPVPAEESKIVSVKKEKSVEKENKHIKKEKEEKEIKSETRKLDETKSETKKSDETKSAAKKSDETKPPKEEEEEEEEKEEEKKIDIWEKRTVGKVFEDALKRYLERKAARLANRSG